MKNISILITVTFMITLFAIPAYSIECPYLTENQLNTATTPPVTYEAVAVKTTTTVTCAQTAAAGNDTLETSTIGTICYGIGSKYTYDGYVGATGGNCTAPNNAYNRQYTCYNAVTSESQCVTPDLSHNGIKDNGEDGIDCGGTTGVTCSQVCQAGFELLYSEARGFICVDYTTAPQYPAPSCPSGEYPVKTNTQVSNGSIMVDGWACARIGASPVPGAPGTVASTTGIGCGGSTGVECVKMCPSGEDLLKDAAGNEICGKVTVMSPDGQCSAGSQTYNVSTISFGRADSSGSISVPVCAQSSGPPTMAAPGTVVTATNATQTGTVATSSTGCVEKIMPDGQKYQVCTNSDGSKTYSVRAPDGTSYVQSTEPITRMTPEGWKQVTYPNGDVCTYTTDASGNTMVACVGATGEPTTAPSTAVGDGELTKIASNTFNTAAGLDAIKSGITDSVSTGRFTLSTLEQTNALLGQLLLKPGIVSSGSGGDATVTNQKLDAQIAIFNEQNAKINAFNDSLAADKATNHDSSFAALEGQGDGVLNGLSDIYTNATGQINDDFDPSRLPVNQTITNKVKDVMPHETTCTDIDVNFTAGYSMSIPCAPFVKFKVLFSWFLYVLTVLSLYETVFVSSPGRRR